jgi:hypothetical protein
MIKWIKHYNKELQKREKKACKCNRCQRNLIKIRENKNRLNIANKELAFKTKKKKKTTRLIVANKEHFKTMKRRKTNELSIAKRQSGNWQIKSIAANMSPEIRTRWDGILGFANLLKNQVLQAQEQQNYISRKKRQPYAEYH